MISRAEELLRTLQPEEAAFWATHQGAEFDLFFLTRRGEIFLGKSNGIYGHLLRGIIMLAWLAGARVAGAEKPAAAATSPVEERVLSGEVVAVWCYLGEGSFGTGRSNAEKARNCIRLGSPIALKVGKALYLVAGGDPAITARLTDWVGHMVRARGIITRQEGYPRIAIAHMERAIPP